MSVREGLLALIGEEPRHCYGLKSAFEDRLGHAWALNIGQVYSTLERLVRDGLVVPEGGDRPPPTYRLTPEGRRALEEWFAESVIVDPPRRDELAIKMLMAVGAPEVDIAALVQRQRSDLVGVLQRYTRQKGLLDEDAELPAILLHDALILNVEAQLRWLDLCEERLRRRGEGHGGAG